RSAEPTLTETISLHVALPIYQPENHRGLAGATNGDVAHHDQRHRRPVGRTAAADEGLAATLRHVAVQPLQRRQEAQRRMALIPRSEEHTSELQSRENLVSRLL